MIAKTEAQAIAVMSHAVANLAWRTRMNTHLVLPHIEKQVNLSAESLDVPDGNSTFVEMVRKTILDWYYRGWSVMERRRDVSGQRQFWLGALDVCNVSLGNGTFTYMVDESVDAKGYVDYDRAEVAFLKPWDEPEESYLRWSSPQTIVHEAIACLSQHKLFPDHWMPFLPQENLQQLLNRAKAAEGLITKIENPKYLGIFIVDILAMLWGEDADDPSLDCVDSQLPSTYSPGMIQCVRGLAYAVSRELNREAVAYYSSDMISFEWTMPPQHYSRK